MNPLSFAEIWKYVGPLAGAVLGFIGNYLLERRRERRKKSESLQVVECVELVNTKVLDEELLGPMAGDIQIKVPEAGPKSELIDVHEIYFARFRLRNLSDTAISKLLISAKKHPRAAWFSITEGEGQSSPDWEKQLSALLEEEKVSGERGWAGAPYPIPYLNPYSSTGHEVSLNLSSYLPLSEVEITGGAKGVKFVFKKSNSIA
jgi:hypothetical protein